MRFNQAFTLFMVLAGLSAFALPPRYTNPVRNVQGLFKPVAAPARWAAASLDGRYGTRPPETDVRPDADVRGENAALREELASLTGQLEELRHINADRDQLGDVRPLCTPVPVVGGDPGTREGLVLASGTLQDVRVGMAVLYAPRALAGRALAGSIERSGPGGSQVRLITDRDSKILGWFARVETPPQGRPALRKLDTPQPLAGGDGKGHVLVNNLSLRDATRAGLREGDLFVLDDPDQNRWPVNLRYTVLGQVKTIQPQPRAPLSVEVRVDPPADLRKLSEVMVLNKKGRT